MSPASPANDLATLLIFDLWFWSQNPLSCFLPLSLSPSFHFHVLGISEQKLIAMLPYSATLITNSTSFTQRVCSHRSPTDRQHSTWDSRLTTRNKAAWAEPKGTMGDRGRRHSKTVCLLNGKRLIGLSSRQKDQFNWKKRPIPIIPIPSRSIFHIRRQNQTTNTSKIMIFLSVGMRLWTSMYVFKSVISWWICNLMISHHAPKY